MSQGAIFWYTELKKVSGSEPNLLKIIFLICFREAPNGLRYLRWGGDGEAVQLGKCLGVENCLRFAQTPQRQVHALLARF